MKVLFIITKSNWGGAQSYVYDLATACARTGITPIIAAGPQEVDTGTHNLLERANASGIRTIPVKNFTRNVSVFREIKTLHELLLLIHRERPDIVHVNSSKAAGIGAFVAWVLRVPTTVFTVHGWAFREQRISLTKALIWLSSWVTALLADSIIVVSAADARDCARMPFIRHKVHIIHNGIGAISFKGRAEARAIIRSFTGREVPDAATWVWTSGELTKNKGIPYALRAVHQLKNGGIPIAYLITGSGENREYLEKLAQELNVSDIVYFCGHVLNAATYARAFDLYLLPSIKEGLPYVLLEAGLAELPTIATSVGGVPEIIIDEESGAIVPAASPDHIADAIRELVEDPDRARLFGKNLRARVEREFSLERMVRETLAVYRAR